MILVDTSIWADHLGAADPALSLRLASDRVVMHPYVVGELAMGNLPRRASTIRQLLALPQVRIAFPAEVLAFIERHGLAGGGVGYVDAHLLCAARLAGVGLWTRDRRLKAAAEKLGLASNARSGS